MPGKFNDSYFDELGNSAGIVAQCVDAAETMAAVARATAPVDTGAYRDGIHVVVTRAAHRVVVKVVADAEDSMIVESMTGNLARAARSAVSGG